MTKPISNRELEVKAKVPEVQEKSSPGRVEFQIRKKKL